MASAVVIYVVALALVAGLSCIGIVTAAVLGHLTGAALVFAIWQPWRARPDDYRSWRDALGDWGECILVALLWPVAVAIGLAS